MTKHTLTSLLLLGATLAACTDGGRAPTAPDEGPSRNAVTAGIGFGSTGDGPLDILFADEGAPMTLMAAAQAATGGRASGHVGFGFTAPTVGLLAERYSFTALGTDAATGAAKGQFEMMLTSVTNVEQRFHGDVICMTTIGNTTRLAGQLTKVWINNVQRPITGATHVIWTVVDNGEGGGAVDQASPMFFNNATNAALHCSTGFTPPQFPVAQGNVQVQP